MKKTIGYSMVAVQFFAQISPAFAGVFQADEQSVAQTAVETGRMLQGSNSSDAARQMLTSQASGQAADAVTQWLNQFGTAKTQLSVDRDFSLKGSSLDVLLPFYNTPKNVSDIARTRISWDMWVIQVHLSRIHWFSDRQVRPVCTKYNLSCADLEKWCSDVTHGIDIPFSERDIGEQHCWD
ncbi:UNVERIFIED_ORG: inverse autotransporter-like protein with beta domain [Citrobacter freundii]